MRVGIPLRAAIVVALCLVLSACGSQRPVKRLAVVLPQPALEALSFGADEMKTRAVAAGWQVVPPAEADAFVVADTIDQASLYRDISPKAEAKVPSPAESFALAHCRYRGRPALLVLGRDKVGAMYGLIEVGDLLALTAPPASLPAAVPRQSKQPYLELRAVNPFLHREALEDTDSWYFKDEFWKDYIRMLARTRHNFLDFHAGYDIKGTGFPNVFPYLVHLEEFPQPGRDPEIVKKRMQIFRRVTELADEYGIKVGLMNYHASARVSRSDLAEYTAKCVERLLRECPKLWAFGFRIGESGQPEDFFKHAYIAGIRAADRPIELYTRTWIASREKIMEIAQAHKDAGLGNFIVEIKYNGEHLGAPYAVQGSRMSGWGSYSYQGYTNYPRNYSILWQIRSNGTHRIFLWGDPEFARRVARNCRLGESIGFTMEPMTAYYPMEKYPYLNPKSFGRRCLCEWTFDRNWFWYEVWGRATYDPDVPDAVFEKMYCRKYGPEAGPKLYRAQALASKLIPLIYSYHCLGPDHRNMVPEMETGNGHRGSRRSNGRADMRHYDISGFLRVEPLDESVMLSPPAYVRSLVEQEPDGRVAPGEMCDMLDACAAEAEAALAGVKSVPAEQTNAFKDLACDVHALAELTRYYTSKIRGCVEIEKYRATSDPEYLEKARTLVAQAIAHWNNLAEVTDEHYLPLIDRLRMYTAHFTWGEEGKDLPNDLAWIDKHLEAARKEAKEPKPLPAPLPIDGRPEVRSLAPSVSADRKSVTFTLSADAPSGVKSASLLYKHMPSYFPWHAVEMERSGNRFQATVPLTPQGMLYRAEVVAASGAACLYPDVLKETPYRWIKPWAPGWNSCGFVELPEGTHTYTARVGERVFEDQDYTLEAIPKEMQGLLCVRQHYQVIVKAQNQRGGGIPIRFRAIKPVRVFAIAFSGKIGRDWVRTNMTCKVGEHEYKIHGRDCGPGDHKISVPVGIFAFFAFREKKSGEAKLERGLVTLAGQKCYGLASSGFVTVADDYSFYTAKKGEKVYNDRRYAIIQMPPEAEGAVGVRFSNDDGKAGRLQIPVRLDKPARCYVVFGHDHDGAWARPSSQWKLLAKDAYKHGPDDEDLRPVYYRDLPAGESLIKLHGGTCVILGFKERND